jgi:hypothetical protein
MSDFCYGDEVNTLCNNDFEYENSMIIRPPNKKESKLAQKFIFIDTADYDVTGGSFTVEFDETIKDIVEIELMSCHMPLVGTNDIAGNDIAGNRMNYGTNTYLLLFLDNLDLGNYKKISTNQNIQNCFARLPIQGKSLNTFFGRIKNFTNVYQFKPILQKLKKLNIRISDRDGNDTTNFNGLSTGSKFSVQFTFGITYQTSPDLFD